jgi:hypothetical protein
MNRKVLMASLTVVSLTSFAAMAGNWYGVGLGYGLGAGGMGWGGASTPASAAGHAMGDMIRSQGMYNQMTTAGMINVEEARSKYIENQKQWTEVYMQRERILAAQRAQRTEDARARNAQMQEFQATHSDLPPRLPTSELDPATGKITWPSALMRDGFASNRKQIDDLFATRAHTGTMSELSSQITRSVKSLQDELRKNIREIVPQEYMDARRFLDRLSLEGRFPAG